MRVIHIINSLRSGGAERQVLELLKGISKYSEIECFLVLLSNQIHYSYVDRLNISVHKFDRKSKKDLSIFFKLYALFKKIDPDIVHSWNSMCSVYVLPLVKILGIKFVNGYLRDAPPSFSLGHAEWIRSKLTFPFSDAILANSKAGLKAYNCSKKKSYYIHNGFDFNRINFYKDKMIIRSRFNISTKYIVGMVANFYEKKDYFTYIESAKIILDERNDVSFVAVGDGDDINFFKNIISNKYIDRIFFIKNLENVEPIIAALDIGVLCSNTSIHGEGISNSIMEFMALEKPIIATKCGGNHELIVNGENGFLINSSDPIRLSNKIRLLLNNKNLSKRFGKSGRERIIKYFNLERMTKEHITLYNKLQI